MKEDKLTRKYTRIACFTCKSIKKKCKIIKNKHKIINSDDNSCKRYRKHNLECVKKRLTITNLLDEIRQLIRKIKILQQKLKNNNI
jgi:homospermidine synthase